MTNFAGPMSLRRNLDYQGSLNYPNGKNQGGIGHAGSDGEGSDGKNKDI